MTTDRPTSQLERTGLPEAGRFLGRQIRKPKVWVAIAILSLIAFICFGPFSDHFAHDRLVMDLENLGVWAPVLFVLGHMNISVSSYLR